MRDNKVISIAAALVTVGSCLGLVYGLTGGFGPHLDARSHRAVGQVLAAQTLNLLKPGGLVTVITRDTTTFANPASDVLLDSFRKQLAKAGVKIDSMQRIQIDPLRPLAVPAGDFFQWIKNSAKGSVIVSFMGPPALSETQSAQLGEVKPAIVAFCPGAVRELVDLRSLFARGLLQAAVVSKRGAGGQRSGHLSEQAAFDQQFALVTPANLATLSSAANTTQ